MSKTDKIKIIYEILQSGNPDFIDKVYELSIQYTKNTQSDWWDDLSSDQKVAISEALVQVERGETFTHEEVMSEMKKKYPQLNF